LEIDAKHLPARKELVIDGSPGTFELGDELTIAIPTLNSARYIDITLSFYADNHIPVTVFVDARSVDDTLAVAKRFAEAVVISKPTEFMEELIEPISYLCRTPWLLRLDDDELPTLAMMKFIRQNLWDKTTPVHGFQRHQCAVSCDGRLLSHSAVSPYEHRQWRLYQPDRVKFSAELHTPSFEWEGMGGGGAPAEAAMIHLDWALHSYAERRRKVERYEELNALGQGKTRSYAYYFHEKESQSDNCFQELRYPEFEKPCQEISRRFKDWCVAV
jgi:glycosyltransferase involved in cell wall biosynthesis